MDTDKEEGRRGGRRSARLRGRGGRGTAAPEPIRWAPFVLGRGCRPHGSASVVLGPAVHMDLLRLCWALGWQF